MSDDIPITPVPAPLDMRRVRAALAACEGVPTAELHPGCLRRLRAAAEAAWDARHGIIPPGVGGIELGGMDDAE